MWIVGLTVFIGWIGSVCLHEYGHAIVAYHGGDRSVRAKGYLTLNPTKYLNPIFSILVPLLSLATGGIGFPGAAVLVNTHALRNRGWASAVSAAGPLVTALISMVLAVFLGVFDQEWLINETQTGSVLGGVAAGIAFLSVLQFYMVWINLIPLPPLDGFGILRPWLSIRAQEELRKRGKYSCFALFFILRAIPAMNQWLWDVSLNEVIDWGVSRELFEAGLLHYRSALFPLLVVFLVVHKCLLPRFWPMRQLTLRSKYDPVPSPRRRQSQSKAKKCRRTKRKL